jgi:hypothetical protein
MRLVPPLRLRAALAATAAALVVGACGGDDGGGGSAAPRAEGAGLVPASTAVFIAVNTDFGSAQWQAAEALAARFPSGAEAVDSLLESLSDGGVDVEAELKPALGPETDLAILGLSDRLRSADDAPIVLLTQPRDPAKLQALVAEGKDEAVARDVGDGWYMVADSDALIDLVVAGADEGSLADTDAFARAMDDLEGEAVGKIYVNGPALVEGIRMGAEQSAGAVDLGSFGADSLESIALAFTAEPQGARAEGVARTKEGPELSPYAAELAALVPADALVYVSFANVRTSLEQLLDLAREQTPDLDAQLGQLQLGLGISLEDDLLPIFEGEHALFVRADEAGELGAEVTVVLSPAEPQKALGVLESLTSGIAGFAALGGGEAPFAVESTTVAGIDAKKLTIEDEDTSLYFALVDEHVVLTTSERGIADLAAPSGSLADDPLFQEATQAAGLPDETLGFVYVNVRDGLELAEVPAAGMFGELDPETRENLRSLQYLVAYATGETDELHFSGFLGIK